MKIFEIITEHTGPFKILFEVLKDMLTETNIEIRSYKTKDEENNKNDKNDKNDNNQNKKKEEKNCMKITAVDPTKTVLISLKLDGDNFSTFICKKSKLLIGINLSYFYKLIKSMGKNDILSLSVDHEKKNYLKIKIDSPEEKKDTEFNMKLLDLDEELQLSIPDTVFEAVITMDSQEFNKLCREMNNIADYVEIKCLTDKIIFTCIGEIADRKTTYRTHMAKDEEPDNILVNIVHGSTKNNNSPQIVQGIFELKNLVLFSKCASLCNDIEMYMKNDFPLVIKYTVATLGRILLCLTPQNEEITKNANYSDEEEFYSDCD